MSPIIAHVYLPNGVSVARRTFPGHSLAFVGGHAEVKHEWDMPHVLAMPDARVQVTHEWREWLPKWVDMIPGYENKVKATVDIMEADGNQAMSDMDPGFDAMDTVTFGRHPVGHQCKFCDAARKRASLRGLAQLAEALPV